jgi:hypothetical protein
LCGHYSGRSLFDFPQRTRNAFDEKKSKLRLLPRSSVNSLWASSEGRNIAQEASKVNNFLTNTTSRTANGRTLQKD